MSEASSAIPATFVHVTYPDGDVARCGDNTGELVAWAHVADPGKSAVFNCPACWLDVSGGQTPMGGTQP